MTPTRMPRLLTLRAFAGFVLLASLLLGSTAHAWHHVVDPHCDEAPGPTSHACGTCSALHAAPLAAEGEGCAPPALLPRAVALATAHEAPATRTIARISPRAPPIA